MRQLLALQSGESQEARAIAFMLGQDACGFLTAGMQCFYDRSDNKTFSKAHENAAGVLPF